MNKEDNNKYLSTKILSLKNEVGIMEIVKLNNISLSDAFSIISDLVKRKLLVETSSGKFQVCPNKENVDSYLAENVVIEKPHADSISEGQRSINDVDIEEIKKSPLFNKSMYQILSVIQDKPASLLKLQNIFIGIKVYPILLELINLNIIKKTDDSKYLSIINHESLEKINALLSDELF